MEFTTGRTRPRLVEKDDGLSSLATISSGKENHFSLISRLQRRSSLRNFCCGHGRFEETDQPYFLEACFLCKKLLGNNKDIFMYRGDTPFCSEECRQEQIEMDEAKEKNWNLSASMRALRNKDKRASNSPNKTSKDYHFQSGTIAAA